MEKLLGILAPILISGLIFLLNLLLPGRWVTGYITKPGTNEKMRYRLNGLGVFIVMVAAWYLLGYFGLVPFDWLYRFRWFGLAGACFSGLIFSLAIVLPFGRVRRSFAADLWFGRAANLQAAKGKIDIKMWLYLTGAVMLELNVLSFLSFHLNSFSPDSSPGIFISAGMLSFFVIDYLTFEEVHLYTYDLFAERVGFKLGWGCLVFYPYFYAIPLWATVSMPDPGTPGWLITTSVLIFICGWILSRGANLQKFFFKKSPERSFLRIRPQTIGNDSYSLLVSGFWGLSRHINYLGEILMAAGIVLAAGYPSMLLPWLYPVYYILLLFTRQADDNRRCTLKYGELWNDYEKRVRWKIIPFIY
jgi:protein-S-isoprenylcysteine O-methyltransferase Ste14